MPKIPQLGDDAKKELPGAGDQVSASKGTFVLWVVRILTVIVFAVCPLIYYDLKTSLKKCEESSERMTERYINKLEGLDRKVQAVEEKADTTLSKAIEKNTQ